MKLVLIQFVYNAQSLICSYTHVELARAHLLLKYYFAELLGGIQVHSPKVRRPLFKLTHPVRDGTLWRDDKIWLLPLAFSLPQVAEDSDALDSLTKAHVVGQNTINLIFVKSC